MRTRHETYGLLFNTVYVGLMTNLLVVLGCAPLLGVALLTDTTRSWPLLALLAPLCAPALVGVFAVLRAFSQNGTTDVFVTFGRAWLSGARRSLAVGALGTAVLVVLGVDLVWALRQPFGPIALPVVAVLMALTIGTALLALVALTERPAVRLRDAVKVCAFLAIRRWYLTIASLAVLAIGQALLGVSHLLALGVASAPVFYLVWANSRFTLRPALDPPSDEARTPTARRRPVAASA